MYMHTCRLPSASDTSSGTGLRLSNFANIILLRKYPEEPLTKSTFCPTTLLYDVSGDSWLSEASYAECCAIHLEVCIASDCRIQNSVVNYMDWASTCGRFSNCNLYSHTWSHSLHACFVTAQIKTCINLYGVYTYLYPHTYTPIYNKTAALN